MIQAPKIKYQNNMNKQKLKIKIQEWVLAKTCMHAKLLPLYWTLWDPMDCSLPGSSVMGFSGQELECVAMPSSRGSS